MPQSGSTFLHIIPRRMCAPCGTIDEIMIWCNAEVNWKRKEQPWWPNRPITISYASFLCNHPKPCNCTAALSSWDQPLVTKSARLRALAHCICGRHLIKTFVVNRQLFDNQRVIKISIYYRAFFYTASAQNKTDGRRTMRSQMQRGSRK